MAHAIPVSGVFKGEVLRMADDEWVWGSWGKAGVARGVKTAALRTCDRCHNTGEFEIAVDHKSTTGAKPKTHPSHQAPGPLPLEKGTPPSVKGRSGIATPPPPIIKLEAPRVTITTVLGHNAAQAYHTATMTPKTEKIHIPKHKHHCCAGQA